MNVSKGDTEFLDLPGGRLAYSVDGPQDGLLVVCAHGMGDTRAAYRHLTPRLTEAGYRVAVVDVRGHGESSADWPSYAPEHVAGDLLALVRHLGGPAVLVGSSSSTAAVTWAAADSPGDVAGAVLISPFVRDAQLNFFMRAAQGLVLRSPRLWGVYYRTLFPNTKPADLGDHVRRLRAVLAEPGRMAATRGVIEPTEVRWTERAGDVHRPVLIMMGTRDPDFPDPEEEARMAVDLMAPAARLAMIEGSGHYPYQDMPGATAEAIRQFLLETVSA
ncbi:alpha/beta fold hydrolase [Planotetraspora kaengkrachanensis]|uniref:Hydrolase n=1 Tax=Planotetraspora kaengkrachanensis TaxID=575193 RepID=A0A8J3V6V7_9ACTN|nr:alpha/beta hydrolase [Planotetraspora kaengkrachanensis]GIG81311.1 hydrolase [Planotetraspora kaengkrachanensis]